MSYLWVTYLILIWIGLAAAADYGAQPAYQQSAYQPPPQPAYQQPPSSYQPSQNSYGGNSYTQQSQPDYTVTDCFATIPSCRVDEANFQPYYSNNVASASDCAQLCLDHNKLGIWYNTGGTTQTVNKSICSSIAIYAHTAIILRYTARDQYSSRTMSVGCTTRTTC